jgi:hypothetical protein
LAAGIAVMTIFCAPFAVAHASETKLGSDANPTRRCLSVQSSVDGVDPCPLLDQAYSLLSRLMPPTASRLRMVAYNFDLERNLRIQQALFREDLIWQDRGYTDRQIDLMVFLAVALSLDRAGALVFEIGRALEEEHDPQLERRRESVNQYRAQAVLFLDQISSRLQDLRDDEIGFYF